MKCFLPVLCVLLLLCSAVLSAGEVGDLYRADIPVQGQGGAERSQAIEQGLRAVFVKVSGQRQLQELEVVQQALASPLKFVQRFRYHASDEPLIMMTDSGEEVIYHQHLLVDFDDQAVNQVLREAALPVWGRARPSILLWVAIENRNNRFIMGGDVNGLQRDAIEAKANERGVPLLFPLLDLEDQASLRFADIWGDFQDDIRRASQRYQPGGVLVGRVYLQDGAEWQGRWTLYQEQQTQRWLTTGASQQQVLVATIDIMADMLGEQFAQAAGQLDSGRVEVAVMDVNTVSQYARAMDYLASIDAVNDVSVVEVSESQIRFLLSLRGNRTVFEQAIVFGETLAPVEAMPSVVEPGLIEPAEESTALHYRLLP